jgi:hypothetical protein
MDLVQLAAELRAIDARLMPAGAEGGARQLAEWRAREPDTELLLSTGDATGAWLTLLVCKRYGVRTFRGKRARPTTIGVSAPRGFIDRVLQPHITSLVRVFTQAKAQVVNELADAWLGADEADVALHVDEDR